MKNTTGTNGHKKSPPNQGPEGPSKWRSHLGAYRNLLWLVFENEQELEKAIDLLWTDELYDLPHDSPDGKSIVIPADALEYFTHSGLKYKAQKLRPISDFTAEEIAAMRRS